ncbi:RNA-directed DNA polymerase-like protein [Gossypium australe]|uniref:RNA-directed DNA polymerase-like protein n=1 Tax=Gossypium australe TaxID=47621 RepID=A0A5B6X2D1_9ROSI|nr:RNA-directed DNA polymerase-like protein [Gossypium australe]
MCIDFTNFSKACPKDSFPLPSIDRLVYAFASHRFMNFIVTFSSYNQILLDWDDQEKTTFIIKEGPDLEVYVDDMLVNSESTGEHV